MDPPRGRRRRRGSAVQFRVSSVTPRSRHTGRRRGRVDGAVLPLDAAPGRRRGRLRRDRRVPDRSPAPAPTVSTSRSAVALVVFAAGTYRQSSAWPATARALQLPLLVVVVVGAAALVGLQPNGPGFLGVFPAVSAAALRLPARLRRRGRGIAVAALAVAWASGGHHPVAGVVLNEFGVVAFYLLATFARRSREANERAATTDRRAGGRPGPPRRRPPRSANANASPGRCTTCSPTRCPAWSSTSRAPGSSPSEAAPTRGRRRHRARPPPRQDRTGRGPTGDRHAARRRPARPASASPSWPPSSRATPASPARFDRDGDERDLGSDERLTLYRVAQEALTNIRKHACPDRVELRLAYEPAGTRLTIEDFEARRHRPPPGDGTGYGLTGMRERAELLGGTLTAGPTAERLPRRAVGARMTDAIRVLLADDQRVVREGLGTLLGLLDGVEVVGTAADGDEAVDLAARAAARRRPHGPAHAALRRRRSHPPPPRARPQHQGPHAHHLRRRPLRHRRPPRRRPRLPHQGRRRRGDPATRSNNSSAGKPPSTRRPAPPARRHRRRPTGRPRRATPSSPTGSPPAKPKCSRSSPKASRTARSPSGSSSTRPPSRATSTTSSPRPASATEPKPSPTPTGTGSPEPIIRPPRASRG